MYIQEKDEERDLKAPPDYSGHTYQSPPPVQEMPATEQATKEQPTPTKASEESVPTGVLTGDKKQDFSQKGGKRGGIFENLHDISSLEEILNYSIESFYSNQEELPN